MAEDLQLDELRSSVLQLLILQLRMRPRTVVPVMQASLQLHNTLSLAMLARTYHFVLSMCRMLLGVG